MSAQGFEIKFHRLCKLCLYYAAKCIITQLGRACLDYLHSSTSTFVL